MGRLKQKYETEITKRMAVEIGIKNEIAVPEVKKVVINQGIGDIAKNKEQLEQAKQILAGISGQTPAVRQARVSVASFGLRRGMVVGLKVTLRGERMYDFLDRLFSIVLPRLRDFRGVSEKSFDKDGNYNLGIEDISVFPEVDTAKSVVKGLEITIVTNAKNKKNSRLLLELLGMPFEKGEQKSG
jgi:large subunit ribosomal protein L5